eukprot:g154.t1
MSGSNGTITDHLAYVLAQAHRGVHLRFEKRLKTEGVQVEHWRVLKILSDRDGQSMGDLADSVLMNHPALTKMIDKMVANGLVHRALDPTDHRKVNIFITDQGRALFDRLSPHDEKLDREFETALGPERMQTLKDLLNAVIDRVN